MRELEHYNQYKIIINKPILFFEIFFNYQEVSHGLPAKMVAQVTMIGFNEEAFTGNVQLEIKAVCVHRFIGSAL